MCETQDSAKFFQAEIVATGKACSGLYLSALAVCAFQGAPHNYREDVTEHDRAFFDAHPKETFLYAVHHSGTHSFMLGQPPSTAVGAFNARGWIACMKGISSSLKFYQLKGESVTVIQDIDAHLVTLEVHGES